MSAAPLRKQLESALGAALAVVPRPAPDLLPTGIPELDARAGGLPRGSLSEICGSVSSGRTSLALAAAAQATARGEFCAVVDASDTLDPASASAAGVALDRLLWVRCGGDTEKALKAADLIVQGGGFGLVIMDLGDIPPHTARRISMTSWFRLRRAVEHTPAVLLVIGREPYAQNSAAAVWELRRERAVWSGEPGCSQLLGGVRVTAERRKPAQAAGASFEARALG